MATADQTKQTGKKKRKNKADALGPPRHFFLSPVRFIIFSLTFTGDDPVGSRGAAPFVSGCTWRRRFSSISLTVEKHPSTSRLFLVSSLFSRSFSRFLFFLVFPTVSVRTAAFPRSGLLVPRPLWNGTRSPWLAIPQCREGERRHRGRARRTDGAQGGQKGRRASGQHANASSPARCANTLVQ